jgi:hypothetical protein
MWLNDEADEAERQRLLPFVTRLACADTPEIERERATYIARHTRGHMTFQQGLEVLEGALAIGRQADALALGDVRSRMEAVQSMAPKSIPPTDTHLFGKLKAWFGAARKPEPVG